MALGEPPQYSTQFTVTLDDESKELIRELVRAVNRIAKFQAPEDERSLNEPRRLLEQDVAEGL